MNRVLVVYGTKSGCTASIAEQIGRTLAEKGATVDVLPAEKAGSPVDYDAVLVGSGVRAGRWHGAARKWVSKYAEALKSRPVAFYTCGLAIREGKPDEVIAFTAPLVESTGVEPIDIGLFAGWYEPEKFPFAERTIMKMMKTEHGDFRDMDAVAEWTMGVAGKLGLAA